METNSIFYSWQSDLPNCCNRGFIKECIEKAIKEANREETCLEIDRDTIGVAGFPNIQQTILNKIEKASVFVADVSIVNRMDTKKMPNPNVLFELGYAVKTIGWERIICLFNEDFGDVSELPFDIRQHRVMTYSLEGKEKNEEKRRVSSRIKKSLSILADKGLIYTSKENKNKYMVNAPTNDIFLCKFEEEKRQQFYMDSMRKIECCVKPCSHGEWEVLGIYEHKGYNFLNDFLKPIEYGKKYVQITCIDLDKDGTKEVLVSVGDNFIELETNIYRFTPDSKYVFELTGRLCGQEKMIVDMKKNVILAPYGSQGLYEEYKYCDRQIWRPAPAVENRIFA